METEVKTAADYLICIFNERKEKNPRYSLRAFARSLGVSSGQLSEILSGKRPLSHKLARRISIALALTEDESQKLIFLVSQQSQFLEAAGTNSRQLSDEEIALMAIAQNLDAKVKLNLDFPNTPESTAFSDMDQELVIEVKKAIRNFRKKLKKVLDGTEKKGLGASIMGAEKAV
ncbi:helix-turn-helix transcriptional regulator [Bdellovibrio sp. HCB337]|uniref:helix-turn-helix transcriptional regulator n=1 Tax=Bdellovibrio sp. HCB337 TaxID=3394358 RepID=UPI0039A4BD60